MLFRSGREVIELEQFVRATKIFLFFLGKEAIEGATVGFFSEWGWDEGVGGVSHEGDAANVKPLAHGFFIRIRLSLALALATAATLFVFFRHG